MLISSLLGSTQNTRCIRPNADIVRDYMESKANLLPMLLSYAAQNPSVDLRVITPCETYIQGFLDWLKQTQGGLFDETL